MCNVYKNDPCFFVYRVKDTMQRLTNVGKENIMKYVERVPSNIGTEIEI